jgi:hypothetical protein
VALCRGIAFRITQGTYFFRLSRAHCDGRGDFVDSTETVKRRTGSCISFRANKTVNETKRDIYVDY